MEDLDCSQPPGLILSDEIDSLTRTTPGVAHAFFIIEATSNKDSTADADNQVRRDGATLVNAARSLIELTRNMGKLGELGPDLRTFVFSATMDSQCIQIYLRWAEVVPKFRPPDQTESPAQIPFRLRTPFHMTLLKSFSLLEEDNLPQVRAILHNILAWGCHERLAELQSLRKDLYGYQRRPTVRGRQGEIMKQGTDDNGQLNSNNIVIYRR